MNSLKQIVDRVIREQWISPHEMSSGFRHDLHEFANALVAALGAQEPVATVTIDNTGLYGLRGSPNDMKAGTKLYAAPVVREGWVMVPT